MRAVETRPYLEMTSTIFQTPMAVPVWVAFGFLVVTVALVIWSIVSKDPRQ